MFVNGFRTMWELHWEVNHFYCLLINILYKAVSTDDISLM
jgi:hypothetical protein